MGFFPVSFFFEIVLIFLWLVLLEGGMIRRMIATVMMLAVVTLLLQKQVFIIETSGVLSISTIGLPTSILTPIVSLFLFLAIVSTLLMFKGKEIE